MKTTTQAFNLSKAFLHFLFCLVWNTYSRCPECNEKAYDRTGNTCNFCGHKEETE